MNGGRKKEVKDNEFKAKILELFLKKTSETSVAKPPWTRAKLIDFFGLNEESETSEANIDYHLYNSKHGLVKMGVLKSERGELALNTKSAKQVSKTLEILQSHSVYGKKIKSAIDLALLKCFLSGYGEFPFRNLSFSSSLYHDNQMQNLFKELDLFYSFMNNKNPLDTPQNFNTDFLEDGLELVMQKYGEISIQFKLGYILSVLDRSANATFLEGKLSEHLNFRTSRFRDYTVHAYSKSQFEEYFLRANDVDLEFLLTDFAVRQIKDLGVSHYLYYGLMNYALYNLGDRIYRMEHESLVKPTKEEMRKFIEAKVWKEYTGIDMNSQEGIALRNGVAPAAFAKQLYSEKIVKNLGVRVRGYGVETSEFFNKISEEIIVPELEREFFDFSYMFP